ncbi:MAG: PocR ligand-binding domain-containing protein [Deltaproteobacteria bacterium]|nr:PocR ligand-binding domain-containing protein [Deltaproteobacteria bacterium]
MKDKEKTKEQLINELKEMRQRVTELEKSKDERLSDKQASKQMRVNEEEQRLKIKLDYLTSPTEKIENLKLTDLIDLEILQRIEDAFAQAHGVASVIEDPAGNPVTTESNYCQVCNLIRQTLKGKENCRTE